MSSCRRGLARLVVVASIGLAGCSVEAVNFLGMDAQAPPGTATLTVARNGTSTGTVSSSPAGIACGAACSASFPVGTTVTLTATPDVGAELAGWSGGCSGAAPTCTVTVDTAATVTATFDVARYAVTVDVGGSGAGMVSAPGSGISCPGTCTGMVAHGDALSLTATAGASSLFMGWTIGPGGTACAGTGACDSTITGPTTITATFALLHALEVTRSGNGTGGVTSTPAGIDCGTDCSELYLPGTTVTLTATPAADSTFAGWSGGGCTGTDPCSVDVTGAVMVTADFRRKQYDLTVVQAGSGAGTVTSSPAGIDCGADCTEVVDHGAMATLTATPAFGSTFAGWSGGGCSGTGTCTVTVTAATTVTATFTLDVYLLSVTPAGTGAGIVTSSPAGISCGTTCAAAYGHGATVTLTAAPSVGSTFAGWSGGGCSGTGTCTVTMTAATAVAATFTLNTYALAVNRGGTGAGTVTSSPAGISCGSDCTETYDHGTTVTLTAAPSTGSTFTSWSGGGCTGTGTCTVTMTAATFVTAVFTLNRYTLSVMKTGSGGGSVVSSPAGISCSGTCNAQFDHGTVVTLTATPAMNSIFGGWSGGGCSGTGTCAITMTAAVTVGANFQQPTWTLSVAKAGTGAGTVTSSPGTINCGSTCSQAALNGSTFTLTATPAVGSTFTGWSGGGCSGTGTCAVTVTANTTVTATFTLNAYALSVNRGGTGAGTVTSSPAGISCGSDCTETYDHGTTVTLTAAPSTGSTFTSWSGGGCSGTGTCTVTMTAATFVTAVFTLNRYTLSVMKTGSGGGSVVSSPAGISCSGTCNAQFDHGTVVTLTATPAMNSIFGGWSGGGCSGTGTCAITMTADITVGANFQQPTWTLSVAKAGTGAGTVTSSPGTINCGSTCSQAALDGSTFTLTATPAVGSTFTGWTGNGCSGTGTCTVTVTTSMTVTATFTANQYNLQVIKTGSGAGSVQFSPTGISCGGSCNRFPHGTVVTITATPAMNSIFGGWSGGGCSGTGTCTVTMTSDITVGANFQQPTWTLAVARAGTGAGTVTSSPGTINCGSSCSQAVLNGSTFTLTASPAVGSSFAGWSGGGCSGTGTCTVTVTANTTVTATFVLGIPFTSPWPATAAR